MSFEHLMTHKRREGANNQTSKKNRYMTVTGTCSSPSRVTAWLQEQIKCEWNTILRWYYTRNFISSTSPTRNLSEGKWFFRLKSLPEGRGMQSSFQGLSFSCCLKRDFLEAPPSLRKLAAALHELLEVTTLSKVSRWVLNDLRSYVVGAFSPTV